MCTAAETIQRVTCQTEDNSTAVEFMSLAIRSRVCIYCSTEWLRYLLYTMYAQGMAAFKRYSSNMMPPFIQKLEAVAQTDLSMTESYPIVLTL